MIDLFLDDARRCPKGFTLARSAEECIVLLKECEVRVLSLDYDLGWDEPTGLEVARHVAASGDYPPVIFLHTSSPAGRRLMYELLYTNKPEHVRLYNHPMPETVLLDIAEGKFEVEK